MARGDKPRLDMGRAWWTEPDFPVFYCQGEAFAGATARISVVLIGNVHLSLMRIAFVDPSPAIKSLAACSLDARGRSPLFCGRRECSPSDKSRPSRRRAHHRFRHRASLGSRAVLGGSLAGRQEKANLHPAGRSVGRSENLDGGARLRRRRCHFQAARHGRVERPARDFL